MINPEELVLMARDGLTELPESVIFSRENLRGLIPQAIALWQERTNSNPEKRHPFLVLSDNIKIQSGVADISEAVEDFGYKLEYISDSDIIITGENLPRKKVNFVYSWDRLVSPGIQDKFFILGYLEGMTITFRNPVVIPDQDPLKTLNAQFKLNSVVLPNSLEDTPKSVIADLALALAEIAKGQYRQQNKGIDTAP